ncbi:hypothetical protein [Aurantibacillus circumpalustris]|uniref:hypothetical protein n=1 Tax=Aurantibacillus circumpalustris TaxID=3036359 RepID=UPI00295B7BA0|nr:hypothetical protein [Aurantibacillus circumpalustris]
MKLKVFSLIVFTYMFTLNLFSQNSSINEIDQMITLIKDELDSFDKIEKINSEVGTRCVYLKDGDVQLITVLLKGRIEKYVEWFYKKGLLIYTETRWNDEASLKPLFIEKTYHNNGIMIAWLDSENSFVDSSSPRFKSLEKELNSYAVKIRNEALE